MDDFETRRKRLLKDGGFDTSNDSPTAVGNGNDFNARRNALINSDSSTKKTSQPSPVENAINKIKQAAKSAIDTVTQVVQGNKPISPIPQDAIVSNVPPTTLPPIKNAMPTNDLTLGNNTAPSAQFSKPLAQTPNLIDLGIKNAQNAIFESERNRLAGSATTQDNVINSIAQPLSVVQKDVIEPAMKVPGLRTVIRSVSATYLGSSKQVMDTLNTKIPQSNNRLTQGLDTVGDIGGTLLSYLAGGEVLKGLQLGKATLPVLFTALGQTSLPADTTVKQRLEQAPVDAIAGWLFSKVPAAKKLLSPQALKQAGIVIGVNSGQTFIDSLIQGLSPKDAAVATAKMAVVAGLLHISGTATGLIGNKVLSSKYRSSSFVVTPDEARQQATETNFQGTAAAHVLQKAADMADIKGKNLQVNAVAAKKSPVAALFHAQTPDGFSFTIDFVDKNKQSTLPKPGVSPQPEPVSPETPPQPATPSPTVPDVVTKELSDQEQAKLIKQKEQQYNITIPKNPATPAEKSAIDYFANNVDTLVNNYIQKYPDEINSDKAKSFFKDQGYNGQTSEFDRVSGALAKAVYTKQLELHQSDPQRHILITGGGPGSGKTTTSNLQEGQSPYNFVFDTTLASVNEGERLINEAQDHGYKVDIAFTDRPIETAFKEGVIPRYKQEEQRVVRTDIHVDKHIASRKSVVALYERYKNDPSVTFLFKKNHGGLQDIQDTGVDFIRSQEHNREGLIHELNRHIENLHQRGEIDQNSAHAFSSGSKQVPHREPQEKPQSKVRGQDKVTSPEELTLKPATEKPTEPPRITKSDFKTLATNNTEFKQDPTLIVQKGYYDTKLVFDGKKTHFFITADALGLDGSKLKDGQEIKVDLSSLKGNIQQMRVYKGKNVFASIGDYADIENQTYADQQKTVIEFPELVNLAKELSGSIPDVKKLRGSKNGYFSVTKGKIVLNKDLFADPIQAAKTLAHELGHLVDYLPDKTVARGNLLGKLASLKRYGKQLLEEFPGAPGMLTKSEKAKIGRRAKAIANKTKVTVEKEIVTGREPTKPEEILAIWKSNTGGRDNKELLSYISNLSQERKVEIVKTAMRNRIPEWVTFVKETKKVITEEVLKNSPADIRKLYKKMLHEEILARRLVDLETVKKELQQLSYKWRPFNPNTSPFGYLAYRNTGHELYADAISVLFNDPARLQNEAPLFWKTFFNYLDEKPTVKETLLSTWDLLNKGEEAVFQERQKNVEKMFDKGEEQFVVKELEHKKQQSSLLYTLKLLFDNKNEPLYRKVKKLRKEGKMIDSSIDPMYAYEGLNYLDGKIENFVEDTFEPVYKMAQELGADGWEKLGSVLLYERAINERGELANPLGFNPKTAKDQLEGLQKSMTPQDWEKLQSAVTAFRNAMQKVLDRAEKGKFYTPELLKQMKTNPAYATFQVIDYLDTYISAHVYKQQGTLKEIANPATSSVIKAISVMKAIERNNAKQMAIDEVFVKNFPDEIQKAESVFSGKGRRFLDPKDKRLGMVTIVRDGKLEAYYVDEDVADTLNGLSSKIISDTANVLKWFTGSHIYRPLFTSFNLGFSTYNFVRDFQRYWTNVPDFTFVDAVTSFPRAVGRYAQAVPAAFSQAKGLPNKTIQEMKDLEILGATYNDMFGNDNIDNEDKQIERILQRVGLLRKQKGMKIMRPLYSLLDSIDQFNDFIEALPKVAGYNELKGKMSQEELADFVRTSIGSPNFRVRGKLTPFSNQFFLFSNAIKEGIKSDWNVAFGGSSGGTRSALGFWWKTILALLPVFITAAGAAGLLGNWYKKRLDDISEYTKTNYTVIPYGVDEKGKTKFITIPRNETQKFIGGLLWKTLTASDKGKVELADLMGILDYTGGSLPSLTPSVTDALAIFDYVTGHNPYDSFRNRNVIPDTEFAAGPKYSLPIFFGWLVKEQGAGIILPSSTSNDPSMLEKVLALPILTNVIGRWVKVSDYGQTEKQNEILQEENQQAAQQTLETRNALDNAIKEYKGGEQTKARERQVAQKLVNEVIGPIKTSADKANRTRLVKRFAVGLTYGTQGALTDSIIRAGTNSGKVKLLQNAKGDLGDQYKPFLKTLIKEQIISTAVARAALR